MYTNTNKHKKQFSDHCTSTN